MVFLAIGTSFEGVRKEPEKSVRYALKTLGNSLKRRFT